MLTNKRTTLKPLIESADGVHLTAYLVNRGDLIDLKAQLRDVISQSYEWLKPVTSKDERNEFLEPLDSLLLDVRIFKEMKGNIGLFRNQDSFQVLNIPVEVEPTCQVATTFHVKPLLKWLQMDHDFLLLGIDKKAAHLYLGSQSSIRIIDSILFPESLKNKYSAEGHFSLKDSRKSRAIEEETFSWLGNWINELTKNTKPKLFLAGEVLLVSSLNRNFKYSNVVKTTVSNSFDEKNMTEVVSAIRKIMKADAQAALEKNLLEFKIASDEGRAQKNIFQISKAVVQGRVRKLLITDEFSVFGKIDRKSGGIALHPYDLDHEDDDVLDDLAQMVLSQGGEVVIAKRDEIPKGRLILAMLNDDDLSLDKKEERAQCDVLQERFG